MTEVEPLAGRISHFIHRRFIWLLLASYMLAAALPGPGLSLRSVSFGTLNLFGDSTNFTLPMLMLGFLLWNGGLGTQLSQAKELVRNPGLLIVGSVANILAPLAVIFVTAFLLAGWHSHDESQSIIAGLTLIAAMPISGSSTAWSQNANGNLALSLGLVLVSTLASPLTTPFSLSATAPVLTGDFNEDLQELAGHGTRAFLALTIMVPIVLGLGTRMATGEARVNSIKPYLKLLNFIDLLILNYSNASTTLPQTLREHDLDFLALTLIVVTAFCLLAFLAGWLIARTMKADPDKQTAMMFGLGMNNNGTALVLATVSMSDHPMVLLQVVLYTLVQNLVAGLIDFVMVRRQSDAGAHT